MKLSETDVNEIQKLINDGLIHPENQMIQNILIIIDYLYLMVIQIGFQKKALQKPKMLKN